MPTEITVPRLNANEDEVLLSDVRVREGDRVKKDDILFLVETTKATFEITSPADGAISSLEAAQGTMVPVGARLCRLAEGADSPAAAGAAAEAQPENIKITVKARMRARELGIDIALVPQRDSVVGVREVEAFAALRKPAGGAPDWIETARSRLKRLPGGRGKLTEAAARELGFELSLDGGAAIETEFVFIGSGVRIGRGVRIDCPALYLGDQVTIGSESTLTTQELILSDGVLMGDRVTVDLAGGRNPDSRLAVGPASLIGGAAMINTCREVVLEARSAVSPGSMIFTHSYWQSVLEGYTAHFRPVHVAADAWVGAGCQVLPGVRVGEGSIVMSNSTVIDDVPPESLAAGVPARIVRRQIRKRLTAEEKRRTVISLLAGFAEVLRGRGCRVATGDGTDLEVTLPDGSAARVRLADAPADAAARAGEIVIAMAGAGAAAGEGAVFDLEAQTVTGPEDRVAFELRNHLRRFGIRFAPYAWRADYRKGL